MATRILELFHRWDDTVDFAAGSVIFAEREKADCMYVILEGEVELTLHGKPLSKGGKGSVVGEMAMLGSKKRDGTATAIKDTRLARLDQESFRECMSRSTDFSLLVMSELAGRLRAVDAYISGGQNDTKGKKG